MIDLNEKKILLVRNDNIGDLICTTPAIEALRKKYPHAQIDIVVNSYNYDAIKENPFIDKTYIYTKPKHKKRIFDKIKASLGKLKILLQIINESYDAVVIFRSGYSKSAELFATLSKAKYKIGVQNKNGKDGFTTHITSYPNMHEVLFCFECLKPFGVTYSGEKTYYFIPETLNQKYIGYKDYIIFHISARMQKNRISFSKCKEIIQTVAMSYNKILITAEPKDISMAHQLSKECHIEFLQTDSFTSYGALLKDGLLLLTLEGGSMHLGPAVNMKTLALFGVSTIDKWYPWGYQNLVIQDQSKIAENINTQLILQKIKENV